LPRWPSPVLGQTYYATWAGGPNPVAFGRLDASGNTTPIGSGLNFGSSDSNLPQLLAAPNGTLYAFDTGSGIGDIGSWGSVNLSTGTFTKIGNLGSVFENGLQASPVLEFDSAGNLIAAGYSNTGNPIFGTLNLTTGEFTSTANASTGILSWLAAGQGLVGQRLPQVVQQFGAGRVAHAVPPLAVVPMSRRDFEPATGWHT